MNNHLTRSIVDFYSDLQFPLRYTAEDIAFYDHDLNNLYFEFIDAHLQNGMKILDVGCGTGLITNVFARRYPTCEFTAMDFSNAIRYGEEFAQQNQITNVHWLHQDILQLDTSDRFDAIICQGVLHHIPDYHRALTNIKNSLAPNGTLLLGLYHPVAKIGQKIFTKRFASSVMRQDQRHNPFELSFTADQVKKMCEPMILQDLAPKSITKWISPNFYQSGGLTIYTLRNICQ
jgi:ubiquinone/menaquinone biosynthesis C-methylase UbiE